MRFVRIVCFVVAAMSSFKTKGQVTFVIEQLPKSTPSEDTIFIAGTFNGWRLDDPELMLRKRLDGKYFITLPPGRGTVEYKFHRGSWTKCETDAGNNYKPNRFFTYGNGTVVPIVIENWQDAGGARSFDLLIFYFFAVSLLSAVTAFFLYRIKGKRKKQGRIIIAFLGFLCVALLGRVAHEISPMAWQLKFEMVGDVLLLLSAPAWWFVIFPERLSRRNAYFHAIPTLIVTTMVVMKLLNFSGLAALTTPLVNPLFTLDRFIFYGAALVSHVFYLGLVLLDISNQDYVPGQSDAKFSKRLVLAGAIFTVVLMGKLLPLFAGDENLLLRYEDALFLAASIFPLTLGYYVFKHEEIFKTGAPGKIPEAELLMKQVHQAMLEKKCFKDPNLTLNQLSEVVGIKSHLLSRIINECYHQNFRDFVNKYRVEEFVKLARQQTNKRYTFLALANEVGFNSKSTFNVAFKKVLQQSPREFLKANKILDHFKKDEESLVL